MPGSVEIVDSSLVKPPDVERFDEFAQTLAMQLVEPHPFTLAISYTFHRGLVHPSPSIRECFPVGLDTKALAEQAAFSNDARSPVHDGAEHVEDERFD